MKLATIIATALAALSGEPSMPNARLTPGVVATTDVAEVCAHPEVPGSWYSLQHRQPYDGGTRKARIMRAYGLNPRNAHDYELDDRVPICLGGDNASDRNLWPMPWSEARVKDRFEAAACRAVCSGRMPLATAQKWFLGDWRAAYDRDPSP